MAWQHDNIVFLSFSFSKAILDGNQLSRFGIFLAIKNNGSATNLFPEVLPKAQELAPLSNMQFHKYIATTRVIPDLLVGLHI